MKKTSFIVCILCLTFFNLSNLIAEETQSELAASDSSGEGDMEQNDNDQQLMLVAPGKLNTEGIENREKEPAQKGEIEVMPLSGTVVRHNPEPKKLKLTIAPEVFIGGTFSNYRGLGYFAFFDFGGAIGATIDEKWHLKLSILALSETHRFTPQQSEPSTTGIVQEENYDVWFIQPSVYVMYNVSKYPDYHYWVPMDLFVGVKLGANIFRPDKPFYNVKDENDFLYGIAMNARFYLYKRFGISGNLELSTIDYFKNFFFHYGASVFWDFEVLGKDYDDEE